jgi:predicted metal-dependent hydrolase
MNHSQKFHQLVKRLSPDHKKHEKILHQGQQWVPGWFLSSLYSK